MSVVAAGAAVAAAAAESVFTKLASRSLLVLSRCWVGVGPSVVFVGLGGLPPMRSLKSCVTRFRLDTLGWTEPKAGWLEDGCSRLGVYPGCLCDPAC